MAIKKADIERWQSQSVKELEELLQHNDNIIQDHRKKANEVENCNEKIEEILKEKREKEVRRKLKEQKEELEIVLSLMEHTEACETNQKAPHTFTTPGVYDNGRCFCPKCTLKYLIENPWAGFGFRITAQFDFDNDGIFEDDC